MNAAPGPLEPRRPQGAAPSVSAAAERARAELHQEIERVRVGVEEMLAESGEGIAPEVRRELDALREDTRLYVKKRIRRTERKVNRSVRRVEERTDALERRIDQVESDREAAEYRIHSETERLLDGLLQEVRAIADLLTRHQ